MAVFKFILQVFALQLVLFTIIIFVLLKILNRHLIELALHQLELLFAKEVDQGVQKIVVTVVKTLSDASKKRIESAVYKKLGRTVPLVVEVNPQIKGGMIISINNLTIDCSLISRLKDSGFVR